MNARRTGQLSRGRRRGVVFSVRVTDAERAQLEALQRQGGGPHRLGPFMLWRALHGGTTRPGGAPPVEKRTILDLCAGSGAWSEPYARAGYHVVRVTLPDLDVRTFVPPGEVWGVLAAPPCTQFSLARNGHPQLERDFIEGMACINACVRIVHQVRASLRWWALENPVGHLGEFLGTPRDVFEPCDFGDPWTKRTALWGDFALPLRGPFVAPLGGGPLCTICDPERRTTTWCSSAAHRAVTPAGFARAFFEANP